MINQTMAKRRLEEANKHIADAQEKIAEQKNRIADMPEAAQDIEEAEIVLASFANTLELMHQHRNLILSELDEGNI